MQDDKRTYTYMSMLCKRANKKQKGCESIRFENAAPSVHSPTSFKNRKVMDNDDKCRTYKIRLLGKNIRTYDRFGFRGECDTYV